MYIETRLESPATHRSDSTSTTSSSTNASGASSPSPQLSILGKGPLITASLTRVDVTPCHTSIKGSIFGECSQLRLWDCGWIGCLISRFTFLNLELSWTEILAMNLSFGG
ncbi:hypothetical protein LIER_02225 [Lithospermum erythrorhizon]|uniref:Uncharacterized protein n=1 Tax=Lithospermum erythrorhizon TaxID=34254 RepID=A0AAV3NNN6_LITER